MIFVDGVPERITATYFRTRYAAQFPNLIASSTDAFLATCIDDVYTMFVGVGKLWNRQLPTDYYKKTQMCYGLLLAWYIADIYPLYCVGTVTSSGIPLKNKSIGGVKVSFGSPDSNGASNMKGYKDALAPLRSNPFGYKAYMMITSASAIVAVRGRRTN